MAHFEWEEKYSVKNSEMDHQHQKLFDYINAFYDQVESGTDASCQKAFVDIVKFTEYHFRDEEAMMDKVNYPDAAKHKIIHKQLVSRVTELGNDLAEGKEGAKAQIKVFLKNWLTAHIMGIDMKYSEFV